MQSITYTSAEAFLADARQPQFDCLIIDVQLGGMSGIDLGRLLEAEGRSVPFIYVTGHDDPGTRADAEAAGGAAYFRKADPGADLLDAIRRVARRT
jgi:FixJ family two-component response regulator